MFGHQSSALTAPASPGSHQVPPRLAAYTSTYIGTFFTKRHYLFGRILQKVLRCIYLENDNKYLPLEEIFYFVNLPFDILFGHAVIETS